MLNKFIESYAQIIAKCYTKVMFRQTDDENYTECRFRNAVRIGLEINRNGPRYKGKEYPSDKTVEQTLQNIITWYRGTKITVSEQDTNYADAVFRVGLLAGMKARF